MSKTDPRVTTATLALAVLWAAALSSAHAQEAVTSVAPSDAGSWTALSADELKSLVGPVALYPDDLIAIVLPASTFPLQVVQASRFLEAREENPELEPDESWDDSIVALLNYPEVLALLNDDLDWTYDLGEAVVYQQGDVLNAVQSFRDQAQSAGNLATDDRQVVAVEDDGAITISPADPEVIYVPYYDPARVVMYSRAPVYHYYPYGYPLYYYPYPVGYSFGSGFFWGVTTAFLVSWPDHYLHVSHYSQFGHPYYGYSYYSPWYARTNVYVNVNRVGSYNYWRPSYRHGGRPRQIASYSRLRDRNYVRSPVERRIRSGWIRDQRDAGGYRTDRTNRTGGAYRTPNRNSAPATIDEQRARRVRSGRYSAEDLQGRNRATRTRNTGSTSGNVAREGNGRVRMRSSDVAPPITRQGNLARTGGARVQTRGTDGAALGRLSSGSRLAARTPTSGRAQPSVPSRGRIAQPRQNPRQGRSGVSREQPMSPPRAQARGQAPRAAPSGRANVGQARGLSQSAGRGQARMSGGRANSGRSVNRSRARQR